MVMDKEKTKTVFRIHPDGDVIALFPQIAASVEGYPCQSYMHVGQHGAARINCVILQTRLAKPAEFNPLLKELKQLGYNPLIAKRCTNYDRKIRELQYAK